MPVLVLPMIVGVAVGKQMPEQPKNVCSVPVLSSREPSFDSVPPAVPTITTELVITTTPWLEIVREWSMVSGVAPVLLTCRLLLRVVDGEDMVRLLMVIEPGALLAVVASMETVRAKGPEPTNWLVIIMSVWASDGATPNDHSAAVSHLKNVPRVLSLQESVCPLVVDRNAG